MIKSRAVHFEGARQEASDRGRKNGKHNPLVFPLASGRLPFNRHQVPGLFVPNTLPFLSVPCLAVA